MAKRRRRRRGEQEESQPAYVKYLVLVFGVVAIAVAVSMGTRRDESATAEHDHDHDHAPAALISTEAKQIATHFICARDRRELATCTCPTAEEERQLIQAELDHGESTEHIMQLMHDKYGGLKPEFADKVKHKQHSS